MLELLTRVSFFLDIKLDHLDLDLPSCDPERVNAINDLKVVLKIMVAPVLCDPTAGWLNDCFYNIVLGCG